MEQSVPDAGAHFDEYMPAHIPNADDDFLPEPLPGQSEVPFMSAPAYPEMPPAAHSFPIPTYYDADASDELIPSNAQKLLLAPNEEIRLHAHSEPLTLCCLYGDANVLCNNIMPKQTYYLPERSIYWIHSINGACISIQIVEAEKAPSMKIHTIIGPEGENAASAFQTPSLDATQHSANLPAQPVKKSGFRLTKRLKKVKEEKQSQVVQEEETKPVDAADDEDVTQAPAEEPVAIPEPEKPIPIKEVKLEADHGAIQLFKGLAGPISFYQEFLKKHIITPRLSNQTPFRVLFVTETAPSDLYKAICAMLVNLTRIFGMSSILVDLDTMANGLINAFPQIVSAIMLEESLTVGESFEKYVPIMFPTGTAAEGDLFTKACTGLAKTMLDMFLLQKTEKERLPFGGSVVMCTTSNMDVIKGVTSLYEITDLLFFGDLSDGQIAKSSFIEAFQAEEDLSAVRIHELPHMDLWDCTMEYPSARFREYFFGRTVRLIPPRLSIPLDALHIFTIDAENQLHRVNPLTTPITSDVETGPRGYNEGTFERGEMFAVSSALTEDEVPFAPIAGFCVFQGVNEVEVDTDESLDDPIREPHIILLAPGAAPLPSNYLIRYDLRMRVSDMLL